MDSRPWLQGLKDFVKREFEREHPDITVTVSTNWDLYNVNGVGNNLSLKQIPLTFLKLIQLYMEN